MKKRLDIIKKKWIQQDTPSENSVGDSLRENGTGSTRTSHPERAYRNFFKGYRTQEVLSRNKKKTRIQYEYVGTYYSQELTAKQRIAVRCLYVFLYLLNVAAFIWAATRLIAANRAWYVGIFQATAVLGLGWLLISLIYYVPAKERMDDYVYRRMICFHFRIARLMTLASFALLVPMNLLSCFLHWEQRTGIEWCATFAYLLCTVLLLCMCRVENGVHYSAKKAQD